MDELEDLLEVLDETPGGHIGCDGCKENLQLANKQKDLIHTLLEMLFSDHEGICWVEGQETEAPGFYVQNGCLLSDESCLLCRTWVERR